MRSTPLAAIVSCLAARAAALATALVAALATTLAAGPASATTPAVARAPVTVFAASSLKESLDAIAAAWRQQSGQEIVLSYAASSALAKQIEQGAPADVFASADREWMDYLAQRAQVDPSSRFDLARNTLVLVAPVEGGLVQRGLARRGLVQVRLAPPAIAQALGRDGRLAVAETQNVPAGRYARQSLTALGLWPTVSARLAPAENVRAALAFVARGESPLGVVYETDARAEPRVRVVARFPASSHAPIVYPAARVSAAPAARSAGFLAFLRGPRARALLRHAGFGTP